MGVCACVCVCTYAYLQANVYLKVMKLIDTTYTDLLDSFTDLLPLHIITNDTLQIKAA